jgi:hypothetical protein
MSDKSRQASESPETEFDFGFRPDYWLPDNPLPVILGNVAGEMRRRALEMALREGDVDGKILPDEDRADILSEERRAQLASIHPWFMGGEYLEGYLPGELEIGRIVLASARPKRLTARTPPSGRRTAGPPGSPSYLDV